jgi:hypothetical protein
MPRRITHCSSENQGCEIAAFIASSVALRPIVQHLLQEITKHLHLHRIQYFFKRTPNGRVRVRDHATHHPNFHQLLADARRLRHSFRNATARAGPSRPSPVTARGPRRIQSPVTPHRTGRLPSHALSKGARRIDSGSYKTLATGSEGASRGCSLVVIGGGEGLPKVREEDGLAGIDAVKHV